MDKAGITSALSQGVLMEKLLYFVGGIIVGSISTLAALGFSEEELDGVGGEDFEQENLEMKQEESEK